MKVYTVGFSFCDEWTVIGVFSTEEKAVEFILAQGDPDRFALSPVELDQEFPTNAWEADYMWWPTKQTKEDAIVRAANLRAQMEAAKAGKL